jgi:uncharacterized metal-binding protein
MISAMNTEREKKTTDPRCALCTIPSEARICCTRSGRGPAFCPTLNKRGVIEKSLAALDDPGVREFARLASVQEAECYAHRDRKPYVVHPVKPRLQEIMELAGKLGFRRLGLAFCEGLKEEAAATERILEARGFDTVSVMCKVGGTPKECLGIREDEKILIGEEETMCNPIAQAGLLNDAGTELNILLGLCVGHDSLFIRHARAYTTVFAVKDRVLGHNPLALIYTSNSYSARFLEKDLID